MTGGTGLHGCRCRPLPLRPAEAPSQHVAPSYCSNAPTQNVHDFWRQLSSPDTSWLLNRSSNYAKIPAPSLSTTQNENTSYSTDRTDVPSTAGPAAPIVQMGHLRHQIKPGPGPHSWGVVGKESDSGLGPCSSQHPLPRPLHPQIRDLQGRTSILCHQNFPTVT